MEKFDAENVPEELQLDSMKPLMSGRVNFKSRYGDMHDEDLGQLLVALAFAALGALLQGVSGSKAKEDTEGSDIMPRRMTLQRAIGQLRSFARSAQDLHDRLTELIEEKGKETNDWGEEKVRFMRRILAAEEEVKELKKRRSEDAKANEKVVRIYANREQAWKLAKQKLRHEVDMLKKVQSGSPRASEFEMKTRRLADIEKKLKDREVMAKAVMEKAKADCLELTSSFSAQKLLTAQLNEKLEAELANSAEREKVLDEVREKLANSEKELESTKAHLEALSLATVNHSEMTQKFLVEFATLRQESEDKDVMIATMLERASVEREVKEDLARELAAKQFAGDESAQWNRLSANLDGEEVISLRRQVEILEKQVSVYRTMSQASSASTPVPALFSTDPLSAWFEVEKGRIASQLEEKHWNQVETFERHLRAKDERLAALRSKLISMESALGEQKVEGDSSAPVNVRPTEQTKTLLQNILRDVECVRCARMAATMEKPPLDLKDSNDKLMEKEAVHLPTVEDVQEKATEQPERINASAYSRSARQTFDDILDTQAPSKGTRPARIDMEDEKSQRILFTDMDAPITNPTFVAEEKIEKKMPFEDRKMPSTRDTIQVLGSALEVRRFEEQLSDMNSSIGNAQTLLSRVETSVKTQGCLGLAGKVSRLARNIGLPRSFRKASAPKLEKRESSAPVLQSYSSRKNPLFTQEADLASLQQRAEKEGGNHSATQARLTKESSPEFYEPLLFPECKFRTHLQSQVQGAPNSKLTASTRKASPKHSAPPPMTILTSRTPTKPASKPISSPTKPASKPISSPTRPPSKLVSSPTRPASILVASPTGPASKPISSPTRPASLLVASPTGPASKPISSPTRPASKLVSSPTEPAASKPISSPTRPAPTKSKPVSSPTRPVLTDTKHSSPVNFPSTKPPALRIIRSTKLLTPSPVTPTKPVPSLRKEGSAPNRTHLLAHPKTTIRDFMKDDCKMRTAFGRTEPRTKTSSRNEIQPRQWARTTSTHFELDLEHLR